MGDARFAHLRYHFRTYQDFMAAVPQSMRGLPVYITESNQGDQPWENANTGWVRAAYAEIDRWNRANTQKIRSFLLYRWPQVPGDRWGIEGKAGVIEDFRAALGSRFQWSAAEDVWTALRRRVTELEAAAAALSAEIAALNKLAADAAALRRDAEALAGQISGMKPAELSRQLDALEAQVGRPGGVPRRAPFRWAAADRGQGRQAPRRGRRALSPAGGRQRPSPRRPPHRHARQYYPRTAGAGGGRPGNAGNRLSLS